MNDVPTASETAPLKKSEKKSARVYCHLTAAHSHKITEQCSSTVYLGLIVWSAPQLRRKLPRFMGWASSECFSFFFFLLSPELFTTLSVLYTSNLWNLSIFFYPLFWNSLLLLIVTNILQMNRSCIKTTGLYEIKHFILFRNCLHCSDFKFSIWWSGNSPIIFYYSQVKT